MTVESINGGSSAAADPFEATLDIEWASSIAPGAKVRLYAMPDYKWNTIQAAENQILNDLVQSPGLEQVSISICGPENQAGGSATLASYSQTYAQLAAAGVTVLACSGDGGSNPQPDVTQSNGYSATYPLSVEYPASDPNVTGVGGTTIAFNADWTPNSESAWFSATEVGTTNTVGTGGGTSGVFARPSWQMGNGVPPGTARCVPDLSAQANAGFQYLKGQDYICWGTSLATPIWAGITALLNQSRSSAGIKSIGLLASKVYEHIGTNAFNDITSGSNGAYSTGVGYDLCTGVGSPNVANLIARLNEEITVVAAPKAPVNSGATVTMSVTPQVPQSTFQWMLDGVSIVGATNSSFTIGSASTADSGTYTVVITNVPLGSLTYNLGTLSVNLPTTPVAPASRLINISTRAFVGTGSNILIPGFVISGPGVEKLLIRAIGPGLAQFNVTGVLAQPILNVLDKNGATIASNTGWGTNTDPTQIVSAESAVGAFAMTSGSGDSALLANLPAGQYTVQVSGVGGQTGVALAEVYEVTASGTRLINVSTRTQVGTGGNILIPGFVIGGSGADQLLVRADGPGLAQFGVGGVLARPSLSVLNGQTVIASNTGWGTGTNPAAVASAGSSVGAFALATGSADSAIIVSLQPGAYTAQIAGQSNSIGVALAEIYEMNSK